MSRRRAQWVILDAAAHVMRCDRCGQSEPLSIIEGRRLEFACKIMEAFVALHADCQEEPKQ